MRRSWKAGNILAIHALNWGFHTKFFDFHLVVAADEEGFLMQRIESSTVPRNELTSVFWVPRYSAYLEDLERIA